MNDLDSDWLWRHARWIQRSGVLLFPLGLFNGFVVHTQALPGVVLAAHLVALMGGTFLIAIGLLWSGPRLSRRASRVGFWLAVYAFADAGRPGFVYNQMKSKNERWRRTVTVVGAGGGE